MESPKTTDEKEILQKPEILVGIGDLHGHIPALEGILEHLDSLYQIKTEDGKIKPEVHIVFTGDYIDRGRQSLELLEKIMKLSENPNITALNGNHELIALAGLDEARRIAQYAYGSVRTEYRMNTVHGYNGGVAFLENFMERRISSSKEALQEMIRELSRDGKIGKWLRERPPGVVHTLGKKKVLFIHGGIPAYIGTFEELDQTFRDYNHLMRMGTEVFGGSEKKYLEHPLVDNNSLFWVRDMPQRSKLAVEDQLARLGVDYVVFGHTPKQRITMYHDCLFDIDVGMSEAYGERGPAALVLKKEGIFAVDKRDSEPQKLKAL